MGGKHPAKWDLNGRGAGYSFENYVEVPAGRCTLEVSDGTLAAAGKPPASPLASLPADLTAGAFFTVLVSEEGEVGATPQVELVQDGRGGEKAVAGTAQIAIRNFVPSLKDARVSLGDVLTAQFAAGGSYLVMRGVQPAIYQVHTTGTGLNGQTFEWNTEVDLKRYHRQTLLIYPDPYGRIRPRLSVDGEVLSESLPGSGQR